MSTLTSFTLFPSLPTEIRLKIWGIVVATPRTVTVICNKEPPIRGKPRAAKSFTSSCPPPAVLHINRETRYEALAVYTPRFKHPLSPCATYLNLSIDTVKLPDNTLPYLYHTLAEELHAVQSLALETRDPGYFAHYNMEVLKRMHGLEELDITVWKGVIYGWMAGNDYVVKAFEEAKRDDPGWECPRVRVLKGETGDCVGVVEKGASIPGWTEQTAHLYEDANATGLAV
ncbi:hypothetical protein D0Z07_6893 [Hyphodiscus hymeniophilus]|uniref:2EXR domain-containing protein n=1 Tax=Hyphodiscus hymeniophilus TaxID=353542 RepID=A0A9P6VGS2_9HELO|nr:hypothetical protein D0Z07_6893 [Hyphodiscus hymeniophilus]